MTIDGRQKREARTHGPYFGPGHAAVFALVLWLALGVGILWRL